MARLQKKKELKNKTSKKLEKAKDFLSSDSTKISEKKKKPIVFGSRHPVKSNEARSSNPDPRKMNIIQKGVQFCKEVKIELKKVIWPTRKQTAGSTVVVIILVFITAVFLGLVDFSLSKLVQLVLA